jgi:F0F1-type ATP synthase membrane subunit a
MNDFLVNLIFFYNDFDFICIFNNTFFLVTFTSYYFGIKLFTLLFIAQFLIIIFINLVFDKVINYYSFIPKKNSQIFFEIFVSGFYNVVKQNFGGHYPYKNYLINMYPLFFTLFLLILISNFLGLIPYGIQLLH